MSEKRIIKKYPNRRLYDTAVSSYITLGDVKQLILDHVDVQVLEAKTQRDITRNTLLQIVLEQEESDAPLFSLKVLEAFIRFYGASMQPLISQLLSESLLYFSAQQQQLENALGTQPLPSALVFANQLSAKELLGWQKMQEQWWQGFSQILVENAPSKDVIC